MTYPLSLDNIINLNNFPYDKFCYLITRLGPPFHSDQAEKIKVHYPIISWIKLCYEAEFSFVLHNNVFLFLFMVAGVEESAVLSGHFFMQPTMHG
jgi:hypothetical protein